MCVSLVQLLLKLTVQGGCNGGTFGAMAAKGTVSKSDPERAKMRDALKEGCVPEPGSIRVFTREGPTACDFLTLETRARVAVSTLRASGTRTSPFGPGHYMYTVRTSDYML